MAHKVKHKVKCCDCQHPEILKSMERFQKRAIGKIITHVWCPKKRRWIPNAKFSVPRKCGCHSPTPEKEEGEAGKAKLGQELNFPPVANIRI